MTILGRLSDVFWTYVSPRKTQRNRDKPFKAPVRMPVSHVTQCNQFMTPRRSQTMTPYVKEEPKHTPARQPLTPASSKEHRSASRSPYVYAQDLEGDTLAELESVLDLEDEEVFDADDETIVVDEEHHDPEGIHFNPVVERQKREEKAEEQRESGWSEDAIELYYKLSMRGFEPLIPKSWEIDFETLPDSLFTTRTDGAYIKPIFGTEFRAITALQKLIKLGPRVRDTAKSPTKTVRHPEETVRRAIAAYIAWAYADAKLYASSSGASINIPVLALESGSVDTRAETLQANMLAKLGALAERHKEALRVHSSIEGESDYYSDYESVEPPTEAEYVHELPTLYGVIMSSTVMAFVSYDILAPEPWLRTIAYFHWSESDYDVWNSLAIAILVVHCRDRMMELGEVMAEIAVQEEEWVESDDPDA